MKGNFRDKMNFSVSSILEKGYVRMPMDMCRRKPFCYYRDWWEMAGIM